MIEILQELKNRNLLKKLYEEGFVTRKGIIYLDIYEKYDAYRKQGFYNNEISKRLKDSTGLHRVTIHRILKQIRNEIRNTDTNQGQ